MKSQNSEIALLKQNSQTKDIIISTAKGNMEKIQNERDEKARELAVPGNPRLQYRN